MYHDRHPPVNTYSETSECVHDPRSVWRNGVRICICSNCKKELWRLRVETEEDDLYNYAKGC